MGNELIKILYIDDEKAALFNFEQLFNDDFEVYTAISAIAGMDILATTGIQIIIADQRMPDKTGIEFLAEVALLYPDTVRILLTAYSEASVIIDAINRGQVYHYITKPFETKNVKNILDKAAQLWRLKSENQELIIKLQNKNTEFQSINQELYKTNQELVSAYKKTEESIIKIQEIIQTVMDGFWIVDLNGKLIDVNEVACKMLGYTREELLELSIADMELLENNEQTGQRIQNIIEIGEDRFESKHRCKNGKTIDVELSVTMQSAQNLMVVFVRDITDRKNAELNILTTQAELKKALEISNQSRQTLLSLLEDQRESIEDLHVSEERLRLATEQSNVAVWEYDFNSNSMLRSQNHDKLYGLEWQSKWDINTFLNATHPEDREYSNNFIQNSVAPGGTDNYSFDFRVVCPDNSIRWITAVGRVIERNKSGQGIKVRGTLADITEIKIAELALRESEGKFRKIYEEGPFGLALVSREYKFTMANRTFCDITGYSESELKELTFRDITFADDKDLGIESVKKLIKGEIPVFKLEKRYVRKDGQVIWGAITVTAHFDKNGNFLYNLAIIEDITERKQAEEKIKMLNDRLQLLVEAIQELSISTSMENIMKSVRTSARKLVNAEGSTFILRDGDSCYYADEDTVSPLWKGQYFPLTNCISGWAMLNKQSVIIEDIYADDRIPIEAYKSTFVKSLAIAPIRLNNPLGAIGAYWGSNYFPSEIEIKLLNTLADAAAKAVENVQLIEGLEQNISERTSQLQASNKELEAFSYSVSHDLRAPLRHINGFVDLLSNQFKDELPDIAHHYLDTISGASRQMGTLIDELLQYSRTGRQEVRKTQLDMNLLIKEVTYQLKTGLEERKISWDIQQLPKVSGDIVLLKQVWANLLDNAVKYTRNQKTAEISVGCREEKKEFVFWVKDNGAGFDMKYAHKLFGVFQRLHSKAEFEGTGIGLANVQRIVHKHLGRVWAEAEPGKGATFFFSLPKISEET